MNTPRQDANSRKSPTMPMPAVANVPAPRNSQDQVWSEEAARAAQRFYDMTAEIMRLTTEMDEWRRRALGAEADIKRADIREANLTQQVEAKTNQLSQERDIFKEVVIKLSTQFATASQIILDAHKLMDEVLGRKAQVNYGALAEAIEGVEGEPVPAIVRAGPRPPESES